MPEMDGEPSIEVLCKATDRLPSGMAPGEDCIPAEVIKRGKSSLLVLLHEFLNHCRTERSVPQDMRDSNIVTLYKNKGDRSHCSNYSGISLLRILASCYRALFYTDYRYVLILI